MPDQSQSYYRARWIVALLLATAMGARAQVWNLESFIEREMAGAKLPSVSIALVDDQRIVWQRTFGAADSDFKPSAAERARSLSRSFADHSAVDGSSASLSVLPEKKLGAVVLIAQAGTVKEAERIGHEAKPKPAPEAWRNLIGEYGSDHEILYILERNGELTALIHEPDYYPLTPAGGAKYRFPPRGLYSGETLTFRLDGAGKAVEAGVGGMIFPRRAIGPESGNVFRIQPRRPIDQIRREAQLQQPPAEKTPRRKADLVDLTTLDPAIKLDIRYAGTDNFLSTPLYTSARAFMQRPAAEAVGRAQRNLMQQGYGLLIHDAYRPWYVTKIFWEATPDDKHIFVANPSEGSRHNRGCAVDLSLYDLHSGKPIEMVGVYDEMSGRSYPNYPGGTSLQRWHRALLRRAMEAEGFTVFETEWWHFDYKDWREYGIGNIPFERVPK